MRQTYNLDRKEWKCCPRKREEQNKSIRSSLAITVHYHTTWACTQECPCMVKSIHSKYLSKELVTCHHHCLRHRKAAALRICFKVNWEAEPLPTTLRSQSIHSPDETQNCLFAFWARPPCVVLAGLDSSWEPLECQAYGPELLHPANPPGSLKPTLLTQ